MEFSYRGNHLRGFIDVPQGSGRHPAILIIHGSGTTDVFGGNREYNGPYLRLRETFKAAGLATVIWDKAGNGCSTGNYSDGNPIRERSSEGIAALNALKERPEIDSSRMGLWGISQGGWIAPMMAVRSKDVSFIIVVSAPARDAVAQLEYQALTALRASGVADSEVREIGKRLARAFAIMRAGGSVEEFAAEVEPLKKYPAVGALGVTTGTQEQYAAWQNSMDHHYRPDTALRELQQPVLAIFGDRDVLVDWRESSRIYREALSAGGNTDVTIKVFRNSDHNIFERGSDSKFSEGYLQTMNSWLQNHTQSRH